MQDDGVERTVRTHFSVEHCGAARPDKLFSIYIESSRSRRILGKLLRHDGVVGLPASFTSFTFFSGMVLSGWQSDWERNRCIKKKEKKERNNHKPHVSCGFRIKLSSCRGMKEAERRRRKSPPRAMTLIPTHRSDPHGQTE